MLSVQSFCLDHRLFLGILLIWCAESIIGDTDTLRVDAGRDDVVESRCTPVRRRVSAALRVQG